jgi:hypothetical protein
MALMWQNINKHVFWAKKNPAEQGCVFINA